MKKHILGVLSAVLLSLLLPMAAGASGLMDARHPSLESAVRVDGQLTFCGEKVPLNNPDVRERFDREMLLMLGDRAQVLLWLKRAGRYFPYIEEQLAKRGMPDDLKYIPVIESALLTHAGSRAGARGYWQFIRSTGQKYGLTVSRYVDERRNFHKATGAAMKYFTDLHNEFGSWAMSAAAYNMGEAGLRKRVKEQGVADYWNLHLPRETMRYVIRAVVAKAIMKDPAKYGFLLLKTDYYKPTRFDRVRLRSRRYVPIKLIAKAALTYYKTIKDLNPQFLRDSIPPGTYLVKIPRGASGGFVDRFNYLMTRHKAENKHNTYKVRRGDTLNRIAIKHRISLSRLMKLNKLNRRSVIRPGQVLILSR